MRGLLLALPLAIAAMAPAWAGGSAKPDDGELSESHFLKLQPMIVPVLQEHRMRGLVSVQISLQLSDAKTRERVEKMKPKLTDRYIIALNQLGQAVIEIDRPVNLPLIQQILQRSTDYVLGADVARVLIIDASSRAM
ncbi:MAG: hypothetical protein D6782_06135 [Alphaproteobacteria bacterium]|nr:MAG: hypothetical protein D6782_06135 [Alphaproteobacteria bacterium]